MDRRAQTGWTLLGTDICGMPWYYDPNEATSHGTWAVHDDCGRVQKAGTRPQPHRMPALSARPGVAYPPRPPGGQALPIPGRLQGPDQVWHGDEARVRAHLRAGAKVIQVVEALHGDVVRAELVLKRRHAGIPREINRPMPRTFGAGTEVLPAAMMFRPHRSTGRRRRHISVHLTLKRRLPVRVSAKGAAVSVGAAD
jgi:hypothetical protein